MQIGSTVICNSDKWRFIDPDVKYPKKGESYTVRELICRKDFTGIRLEEIINRKKFYQEGYEEALFSISKFDELEVPPMDIKKFSINEFKRLK